MDSIPAMHSKTPSRCACHFLMLACLPDLDFGDQRYQLKILMPADSTLFTQVIHWTGAGCSVRSVGVWRHGRCAACARVRLCWPRAGRQTGRWWLRPPKRSVLLLCTSAAAPGLWGPGPAGRGLWGPAGQLQCLWRPTRPGSRFKGAELQRDSSWICRTACQGCRRHTVRRSELCRRTTNLCSLRAAHIPGALACASS